MILHERLAFYSAFLADPPVVYLQRWHGWCHMKLLPSRRVLCTPNNHAPCHFMQSHIRKVYACLSVTCHLHFWQNDRDLLRASAVTRGWNGYRNKSQHRQLTMEKKILPPLLQRFQPATFRSQSGTLTTELSPPPLCKTSPNPTGFWLTMSGFDQADPVRKASRCERIIRPASGQRFRADPDWMRIGSGMFTGDANNNCT